MDEELESVDDEEISDLDLDDVVDTDVLVGDEGAVNDIPMDLPLNVCGPAEKAAEICRLPARRITVDELAMFPFLEEQANVALRPAYLIARNSAVSPTFLIITIGVWPLLILLY